MRWYFPPEEQDPFRSYMRDCGFACGIQPLRDARNSLQGTLVGIPSKVRILSGWESTCPIFCPATVTLAPVSSKKEQPRGQSDRAIGEKRYGPASPSES